MTSGTPDAFETVCLDTRLQHELVGTQCKPCGDTSTLLRGIGLYETFQPMLQVISYSWIAVHDTLWRPSVRLCPRSKHAVSQKQTAMILSKWYYCTCRKRKSELHDSSQLLPSLAVPLNTHNCPS